LCAIHTSALVLTGGLVGRLFFVFFSLSSLNVTRGFLEHGVSRKHGFTLLFFASAERGGSVSDVGAIKLLRRESAMAHSIEEETDVDDA
jgi:hypothetical protein